MPTIPVYVFSHLNIFPTGMLACRHQGGISKIYLIIYMPCLSALEPRPLTQKRNYSNELSYFSIIGLMSFKYRSIPLFLIFVSNRIACERLSNGIE